MDKIELKPCPFCGGANAMKRMTHIADNGFAHLGIPENADKSVVNHAMNEAIKRLAAYEDAEEQDRLFIPAIKAALGDTVYTADNFGIYESEVAEFRFNRYPTESGLVLETDKGNQQFVDFREFRNNYCLSETEAVAMRDRRRKEAEKRPPQKVTIEYADGHCKVFVEPWNEAVLRYLEFEEKISAGSFVRSVKMEMASGENQP